MNKIKNLSQNNSISPHDDWAEMKQMFNEKCVILY
jgi:hypothetical protein